MGFWQAIEALTPQDATKIDAKNLEQPTYSISKSSCPWSAKHKHQEARIDSDFKWRYQIQSSIYKSGHLMNLLETKIGESPKEVVEESDNRESRLFDFIINDNGIPVADSFELSMAGWAAGAVLAQGIHQMDKMAVNVRGLPPLPEDKLRTQSGFPAFDDLKDHLMEEFNVRVRALVSPKNSSAAAPATYQFIDEFSQVVIERCGLGEYKKELFGDILKHHCVCVKVRKSDEEQDDEISNVETMLNSFYIHDLKNIANPETKISEPLTKYIYASAQNIDRIDMAGPKGIERAYQLLSPSLFPTSKWPSRHCMSFSQQISLNALRNYFFDEKQNSTQLFTVNGPPGTGKTTLLKEVIASVIVDRAIILSKLNSPNDAFGEKRSAQFGNYTYIYFDLIPQLQQTCIVVSSNNNGAVENISLELPILNKTDRVWNQEQDVDYFGPLAHKIIEKDDTWALLAAKLGNKSNRSKFVSKFWYGTNDKDGDPDISNGMMGWLDALKNAKISPTLSWKEAVARFNKAIDEEKNIRETYQQFYILSKEIIDQNIKVNSAKESLDKKSSALDQIKNLLESNSSELSKYNRLIQEAKDNLSYTMALKPGFIENIFSLGKAQKQWRSSAIAVKDGLDEVQKKFEIHESTVFQLKKDLQKAKDDITKTRDLYEQLSLQYSQSQNRLQNAKSKLGSYWPNLEDLSDEERELASFWSTKEWNDAKTEVFLSALALHRAFIENAPEQMYKNLSFAAQWINGKKMTEDMAQTGLDSLALVVPVISSTFASVGKMMANIAREGIGWLLIDEAGQGAPQQSVGVLQRAKRAVVVGDPLQLEPVVNIPTVLEASLAKTYDIEKPWWPSLNSVQTLADQANPLGTCLPGNGFSSYCSKEKIWVGSPLRVHRRCIDPMFSISNEVAYDGLMVYGTKYVSDENIDNLPPSGWIDIKGKVSEGHWVIEEGKAVEHLLKTLIRDHHIDPVEIFLISPFRQVVTNLKRIGRKYGLDTKNHVGTIHTTQGKESLIVILVLGGDPKSHGAKDWAAQKPNLLNVAASRAKTRIYVIADRQEWGSRQYFSTAKKFLPEIQLL